MTIFHKLLPPSACGHQFCPPRYCRFKVGEITKAVQHDLTRCLYQPGEQCVCPDRRCTRIEAC